MAYDPSLEQGIADSNAAQASLPRAVPNALAPARGDPSGDGSYGDPGSGMVIPPAGQSSSLQTPYALAHPIDFVSNLYNTRVPLSQANQPQSGNVDVSVSPDGRNANYGNEGQTGRAQEVNSASYAASQPGPLEGATQSVQPLNGFTGDGYQQSDNRGVNGNVGSVGTYKSTYGSDLNFLRGAFLQHVSSGDLDRAAATAVTPEDHLMLGRAIAQRQAQRLANPTVVNAGYQEAQQAEGERRVANWHNQPGMSGGGAKNYLAASPAVAAATQQAPKPADTLDDYLSLQKGNVAQQTSQVGLQEAQQKLAQQKQLNTLGAQLAGATDDQSRRRIEQNILTIMGKDKPEDYSVQHSAGQEVLASDGITKLKQPDIVTIINKRTGAAEHHVMNQGSAATGTKPMYPEGQTGTIDGQRVKIVNGQPVPV